MRLVSRVLSSFYEIIGSLGIQFEGCSTKSIFVYFSVSVFRRYHIIMEKIADMLDFWLDS